MKIYSIKLKSKNNSNIFNVKTNMGEYDFFGDIIVKYSFSENEVNDELFYSALKESEVLIATNIAMKYLSSRLKTERQIKEYLSKKKFSEDSIVQVLFKLKEYKVIDDSEYALSYIRSNSQNSKMRLKQKLSRSGVNKDLIEKAIINIDDYASCFENAKKYLRNKEVNKETCEKLTRRLQYLGYSWDTIKKVLSRLSNLDFDEY